ncbi:MAG: hypothetical protein D3910_23665, partial [Candidatus Electrothrix sp. ATG2]|nr:hypothetical protein [Candidatus Electrothrix sp. ATG2]
GAFGLDQVLWANTGGTISSVLSDMEWMAGYSNSPEAVNHSLGYGTATTDYSTSDPFIDAYARQYDIMVTKSAGNGSWGATSTTMTYPATAYNIMVVANMDDQNTLGRSDDVRRASSSTGPTVGGRKKPDITAPGTSIMSTNKDWATGDDFISKTGTSMAAPHVAAAALLLADATGNTTPRAQKAILINTADAWTSNDTETTADDGPVAGSHWDKSYGWGYLDMQEAYFNRSDYFNGSLVGRNNNATDDDYKLYAGPMFSNEKATVVWEKRSSGYNASAPPTTQHVLTDIEVNLYDESSGLVVDYDIDSNDNVHQVATASSIDAVIKVYTWSTTIDGSSTEEFSLATEENFSLANPPSFNLSLSYPSIIGVSKNFTLTTTVTNTGDVASFHNNTTLSLPSGFSLVSGDNPASLGTIAAGASKQASWTVQSSGTQGAFSLTATNSSASYAET